MLRLVQLLVLCGVENSLIHFKGPDNPRTSRTVSSAVRRGAHVDSAHSGSGKRPTRDRLVAPFAARPHSCPTAPHCAMTRPAHCVLARQDCPGLCLRLMFKHEGVPAES